jgi:hypothetical protein
VRIRSDRWPDWNDNAFVGLVAVSMLVLMVVIGFAWMVL